MKIYTYESTNFFLLKDCKKELNLSNLPINYCNYLSIKIEKYTHPRSGHLSNFILIIDYEKLKNFVKVYSTLERKKIVTTFTNLEKYGVENPFQSEEIKDKIKATNLEKYGCEYNSQNKEIREKAEKSKKETMLKRYGVDNPSKCRILHNKGTEAGKKTRNSEKWKKENKERYLIYGKKYKEKAQQTKLELYGDRNFNNNDKRKQTCLDRYGVDCVFKTEKNRKISSETRLRTLKEKGVSLNRYIYDDISFDSSWELYFYIYHKDIKHNKIERGRVFEYYYEGKKHLYLCDFLVNGENIEIKGSQYLNEKGELIQMKTEALNKAKQECMIYNNVKVLSTKDIKPIIKMVENYFPKKVSTLKKINKNQV